jgi:hypothetical protein
VTGPLQPPVRKQRKHLLVLWCLFVGTIPFYLGQSGLPQPGNLLILILFPATMASWNGRLDPMFKRSFSLLAMFTGWVLLVDVGYTVVLQTWTTNGFYSSLVFPIYYIYNLMVFLTALVLYQRYGDTLVRWTLYVVYAVVMLQVVVSFFMRNDANIRGELFFNNPNQLGFYSLLAACIIALCQRRLQFGMLKASAGLIGCAYLAFVSASRAAVGGIGILFVLLVFANPRIVIVASLAAVGLVSLGGPLARAIDTTEQRIEYRRKTKEDLVAGRGYNRILEHPEYLGFGAGEGNTMRFAESEMLAIEIHSAFGTILFSYGVVGLSIFLAFIWSVLRGSAIRAAMMVVPVLAYSVTHQGLRSTMLWILFGFFLLLNPKRPKPKAATLPTALPVDDVAWRRL